MTRRSALGEAAAGDRVVGAAADSVAQYTIAPGAQRLQALLAVLALRANQVCKAEKLLDLVCHDNPLGTGLKVVPPYGYRLRRTLPTTPSITQPDGYLLRLPDGALDITSFDDVARRRAQHRDRGDLKAAASAIGGVARTAERLLKATDSHRWFAASEQMF